MKQSAVVKTFCLVLLIISLTPSIAAYEFECNGLYYRVTEGKVGDVELIWHPSYSSIEGLVVPERVLASTDQDGVNEYLVGDIAESAFEGCEHLKSVEVDLNGGIIGSRAFANCSNLSSVKITGASYIGEDAFLNCESLTKLDVGGNNGYGVFIWSQVRFGNIYSNPLYYAHNLYEDGKLVTDFKYPVYGSATEISSYAFAGCHSIESFSSAGASLVSIGEFAFAYCKNLKYMFIPECVGYVGEAAFRGCDNLETVDMRYLERWSVIKFESADANPLYYAHRLNLRGEELSSLDALPKSVSSIGRFAFTCWEIETLEVPASVKEIGHGSFHYCPNLVKVSFSEGLETLCRGAFATCTNLREINIPSSLQRIDSMAFMFSSSIERVDIQDIGAWCNIRFAEPYSNPLYFTMQRGAFYIGGQACTELVLPETISRIEDYAFCYPGGFVSVRCENVEPPIIKPHTFHENILNNSVLYVPAESLDAYRNSQYWQDFMTIEPFGVTTSIEDVALSSREKIDVYNLQGVRMNVNNKFDLSNLPAGLYIINGEKQMIR